VASVYDFEKFFNTRCDTDELSEVMETCGSTFVFGFWASALLITVTENKPKLIAEISSVFMLVNLKGESIFIYEPPNFLRIALEVNPANTFLKRYLSFKKNSENTLKKLLFKW
jgi:hypothetical protein